MSASAEIEARADLREGGRWTLAQAAKNHVIYAFVRASIALARRMPAPLLRSAGRALGAIAHFTVPSARRIALENVGRVLTSLTHAERHAFVRRSYRVLGEHLGDTVASLGSGAVQGLEFEARSRRVVEDAMAEGRGVVFASAHLGPWERVAAALIAANVPLVTLAREAYDPRLTAVYDELRGARGVRAIYRGAPGAALQIVRTLRRGHVLGCPMDLRSRVPSIDVPFLGHPAPTPVGPARVALRTGAAVVVGTVAPASGGKLVVRITRIETSDLGANVQGETTLTARINDELSARILALPEAWLWMHGRFARGD